MLRYIVQRIGQSFITVLIVTVIIFVAVRVVGDPTHLMLPPEATEADRQVLREQLGLSDPVFVQYGRFLSALTRGDMGLSYRFSRPAMQIVWDRAGATFLLTSFALGFGALIGVPLGVASAVKQDTWLDQAAKLFAVLGQAAPPFLFGLIFVRFFSVKLGWLPTSGYGSIVNLILPTIALGWYSAAGLMRLTRSSMLVVRRRRLCAGGRRSTVRLSGTLASSQAASLGTDFSYLRTTRCRRSSAAGRSGASSTPCTSATTSRFNSSLGTCWSALRSR